MIHALCFCQKKLSRFTCVQHGAGDTDGDGDVTEAGGDHGEGLGEVNPEDAEAIARFHYGEIENHVAIKDESDGEVVHTKQMEALDKLIEEIAGEGSSVSAVKLGNRVRTVMEKMTDIKSGKKMRIKPEAQAIAEAAAAAAL